MSFLSVMTSINQLVYDTSTCKQARWLQSTNLSKIHRLANKRGDFLQEYINLSTLTTTACQQHANLHTGEMTSINPLANSTQTCEQSSWLQPTNVSTIHQPANKRDDFSQLPCQHHNNLQTSSMTSINQLVKSTTANNRVNSINQLVDNTPTWNQPWCLQSTKLSTIHKLANKHGDFHQPTTR